MKEEWRDIPGYEGLYQVSSEGRVRSLDRVIKVTSRKGKCFLRPQKGRILRPGRGPQGHQYVVLGHGAHGSTVHSLVALAFFGPCPKGMEVCHNNGNPADNRIKNLRYGSRTDNLCDEYKANRGCRAKITTEQVRSIRKLLASGRSCASIARRLGVSNGIVYCIKEGRTWAWLP